MVRTIRRRLQDDNSVTLPKGAKVTQMVNDHGVRWLHAELDGKPSGYATKRVHLSVTPWAPKKQLELPPHGFNFLFGEDGHAQVVPVQKITGAGVSVTHHTIAVADANGARLHDPRVWEALQIMRQDKKEKVS